MVYAEIFSLSTRNETRHQCVIANARSLAGTRILNLVFVVVVLVVVLDFWIRGREPR
jgi:hypothetical protein